MPGPSVSPILHGYTKLGRLLLQSERVRSILDYAIDILAHRLPLPLVRPFRPALGHALVLAPAVASLYGQLPACSHALPHLAVVLEAPAVVVHHVQDTES